jgi:glycosyltransferase involved in cell wall biosynthesis
MPSQRIVQVTGFYPPSLGGVEQLVRGLSEGLAERGFNVEVFTSKNGEVAGTVTLQPGLKVHYLYSVVLGNVLIIPPLFFKLMKVSRGTIVHLHSYQVFSPEVVGLVSRIKKFPYVAHVHMELSPDGPLGIFLPMYKRFVLGPVLRRAAKVICLTEDYAQLMINGYGVEQSKTIVIPGATSFTELSKPKARAQHPVRLLFVGRLTKQKNVSMLLEALNLYRRNFDSDIQLEIVGDGELRDGIEKLIHQLNLETLVTLRGALFGKELEQAYEESDILVLPTLFESFGLVYVEAMTKGLPVVSTNVLAVRNVVVNNRNGLLTKMNPSDFCAAIRRLVTDTSLYQTISAHNLEDVGLYGWDKVINKIEKVYAELHE